MSHQVRSFVKFLLYNLPFLITFSISTAWSQDVAQLNARNQSLTYDEAIAHYTQLSKTYPRNAKLVTEGLTDCGRPLHLFILSADGTFDPVAVKEKRKVVVLINNGIHPGEPDGIDASVRLSQDLLGGKKKLSEKVVICIIPVYNIDGALCRGCCSRANQDGPEQYGFRGNGKNLDLNRDFIKADTENTRSFTRIFREWDPDVFVDTHVSDGADYQYTMTLISTQHNKLGGPAGEFLKGEMTPALFGMMKARNHEMAPYVNTSRYDDSPEKGIYGFMEPGRFATGYAALYHTFGFVTETHMLKPFQQRVEATLMFLHCITDYTVQNASGIWEVRNMSKELAKKQQVFPLDWKVDSTQFEWVTFRGYEAEYRISNVTGLDQLYYNRDRPYTRKVKFYDEYLPGHSVMRPEFYVVPQAWTEVLDRLKLNKVQMERLSQDTVLRVETYLIDDFKTGKDPYEGRYLHTGVRVRTEIKEVQYLKGDYIIPTNQDCNRYIVETLEPSATDSWFAWGFFDGILQQKEWFSAYIFDGVAEKLLNENPELKAEFQKRKSEDKEFAANGFAQLLFIYKNSPYYEDFRRYPVGRSTGM